MSNLLQQVLEQIRSNMGDSNYQPNPKPVTTLAKIQKIEDELGCKLPELLRQVYLEIGSDGLKQIGLLSSEELWLMSV